MATRIAETIQVATRNRALGSAGSRIMKSGEVGTGSLWRAVTVAIRAIVDWILWGNGSRAMRCIAVWKR